MAGVARGWLSLVEAGRYVGVHPDVLRRAVNAGELKAYEKPATYSEHVKRTYALISVADLDAWVRSLPEVRFGAGPHEAA